MQASLITKRIADELGIAAMLRRSDILSVVQDGALHIILQRYEPDPVPVHLLHVSRGQMPLKLRSFIDFAAPRLRKALAILP